VFDQFLDAGEEMGAMLDKYISYLWTSREPMI
jgi:hypothetical protein